MISSTHIWEIALLLSASFLIGAIPFAYLMARLTGKVDLQKMKAGTVSGTALYRSAGFIPLAIAGLLDVGKGVLVVEIFRYDGQLLRTLALAAAIAGHNWSPYLKGAGGRGIAPTFGGVAFIAWPAFLWLGGIFAVGRLVRHTGIFVFFGYLTLPLLVLITSSSDEDFYSARYFILEHHPLVALGTLAIVCVVFLKRAVGNAGSINKSGWQKRLLYDKDR